MKIINNFLSGYDKNEYLLYTRARLLLIFQMILFCSVIFLQFSMLFAGWEDFVKTLYITPLIFFGMIVGMVFLKKGVYGAASKIVISVCSIAIIGGLIREPFLNPEFALSSYIFFVYPCLALCVIFSSTRFLAVISGSFIIAIIGVFIIMKFMVPGTNIKQLVIFTNNSIFSFVFFYLIAVLISKIFSRNVELASMESERNMRNYDFIKKVLGDNSAAIISSMEKMSSRSDLFSQNTQNLASSIEEITANIEEISAVIDNVSSIAGVQNTEVASMREKLTGLSDVILKMGHIINDSLDATKDITVKAQKGEVSLKNMEQNVAKIRESSQEMTNIVGIINDISDQINLLSLNAAIEAARAGDAGRGFAVVADEISKLADKTASSIKEIKALITTNENETQKGMGVIKDTVEIISTIVSGVNTINEKISNLVIYRDKQTETNLSVTESVEKLKERSGHIALAAEEQKNGIAEILKHISEINDISTSNTAGAEELHINSEELFQQMNSFQKIIDEYKV